MALNKSTQTESEKEPLVHNKYTQTESELYQNVITSNKLEEATEETAGSSFIQDASSSTKGEVISASLKASRKSSEECNYDYNRSSGIKKKPTKLKSWNLKTIRIARALMYKDMKKEKYIDVIQKKNPEQIHQAKGKSSSLETLNCVLL